MKKLLLLLPITLASLFGVQTYTVDTSTHMEVIFVEEIYGRFFTDEDGGIYLTHPVLPSYKEDPEEKEGKLDYISCKEKDMVAFEGYGDFNLRNDSNEYLYGVTKPIKGYPYIIKMNQANESSNSKTYGSQSCTLQYEYTYVMAHFAGEESSLEVIGGNAEKIYFKDGTEYSLHTFSEMLNEIPSMESIIPSDFIGEEVRLLPVVLTDTFIDFLEEHIDTTLQKDAFILIGTKSGKSCLLYR